MPPPVKLKRALNLPMLTLYGLGTTIGAGIYVLTGAVAGSAGGSMWISFLLASLLAGLTALSFAEMASRYPSSAGEAVYTFEGLGSRRFSTLVGLSVALTGVVSSAAIARGFIGYLGTVIEAPDWLILIVLISTLGGLAAWGIAQSVLAAAALTVVEIAGLLIVIFAAGDSLGNIGDAGHLLLPDDRGATWLGIFAGAVLAFYAFIGFEDMVNVAEEVKNPRRTIPAAIILTLIVTLALYVLLALVATLTVPPADLAASGAPLPLIYERATGAPGTIVAVIGMVAAINGALIQIVMASRVIYGLSNRGWLPSPFAIVNPGTRTPLLATGMAAGAIFLLALLVPLVTLAQITSVIALAIFVAVNVSLFRLKLLNPSGQDALTRKNRFHVPLWVPPLGALVSLAFLLYQLALFAGLSLG